MWRSQGGHKPKLIDGKDLGDASGNLQMAGVHRIKRATIDRDSGSLVHQNRQLLPQADRFRLFCRLSQLVKLDRNSCHQFLCAFVGG